jgi:hypothetical protein
VLAENVDPSEGRSETSACAVTDDCDNDSVVLLHSNCTTRWHSRFLSLTCDVCSAHRRRSAPSLRWNDRDHHSRKQMGTHGRENINQSASDVIREVFLPEIVQ